MPPKLPAAAAAATSAMDCSAEMAEYAGHHPAIRAAIFTFASRMGNTYEGSAETYIPDANRLYREKPEMVLRSPFRDTRAVFEGLPEDIRVLVRPLANELLRVSSNMAWSLGHAMQTVFEQHGVSREFFAAVMTTEEVPASLPEATPMPVASWTAFSGQGRRLSNDVPNTYQIFVKTVTGKTITLDVDGSFTIL
jgi:hypothetical protein